MPSSRSDSFYDLKGAAQTLARLAGPASAAPAASSQADKQPASGYVRFSAARFQNAPPQANANAGANAGAGQPTAPAASAPSAAEPARLELAWQDDMRGPSGWAVLLDRSREGLGATGAFVVDPRGLVIACSGALPGDGAEAIGGRLAFAFEQADRIGDPGELSQSIAIQLGETWLTGLRITLTGEPKLIIGICGKDPVAPDALRTLATPFVRKAMGA